MVILCKIQVKINPIDQIFKTKNAFKNLATIKESEQLATDIEPDVLEDDETFNQVWSLLKK